MGTILGLYLVRPVATRSINLPGSFARIGITGTGCQNPQAGTVVRVCFSRQVDDLRTVAFTTSWETSSELEEQGHAGCWFRVLLIKLGEQCDRQVCP